MAGIAIEMIWRAVEKDIYSRFFCEVFENDDEGHDPRKFTKPRERISCSFRESSWIGVLAFLS